MLLGAGAQVLRVLLTALLGGLGGVLRDLLAALERLLARLLGPVLDVVGHGAELLVLDAGGRAQHAGEEADGDGADGEPQGVLLGHALGAARLMLDLLGVRRGIADGLAGAYEAVLR